MTTGPGAITGLVLAGGRGSRMGGADKGLQDFAGVPLALHAARRLGAQTEAVAINANRNLAAYEAFGLPVWPDAQAGFPGPLAGFLAGLGRCTTPLLLVVPCDVPLFPLDLAHRLIRALDGADVGTDGPADLAIASAPQADRQGEVALRPQPVFCLMRAALRASLDRFVDGGGRKIDDWTARHRAVLVPFDRPGDAPDAFRNANTSDELDALRRFAAQPGTSTNRRTP